MTIGFIGSVHSDIEGGAIALRILVVVVVIKLEQLIHFQLKLSSPSPECFFLINEVTRISICANKVKK